MARLGTSALVDGPDAPLELDGCLLYLKRYWAEERAVAADLLERAGLSDLPVDEEVLADGLARLFPEVRPRPVPAIRPAAAGPTCNGSPPRRRWYARSP